jgi:glucan-binding YG repeat protein
VAFADDEYGWRKIGDKWFYYTGEDTFYSNGIAAIGDKCYLFETDGSLVQYHAGQYELVYEGYDYTVSYFYTIDSEGVVQPGWFITRYVYPDGGTYEYRECIDRLGNPVLGWAEIDGKTYYFNYPQVCPNGGTYSIDDTLYLFASDGSLDKDNARWIEQEQNGEISWLYVYADGELATGWRKIEGKWYYFETWSGKQYAHNGGAYCIEDKLYLFGNDGALIQNQTGWKEVTCLRYGDYITYGYTIDAEGAVQPGWHVEKHLSAEGGSVREEYWFYIIDEAGTDAYGWTEIDGKQYYFSVNQLCRGGGMLWVNDVEYLFDNDGALAENQAGWKEVVVSWSDDVTGISSSHTYGATIDNHGVVQPGWYLDAYTDSTSYSYSFWYYFDENHDRASGWKKIDGEWYYFHTVSGVQLYRDGGFFSVDEGTYLFDVGGALVQNQAGWHETAVEYTDYTYTCGCNIDSEGKRTSGWMIETWDYSQSYGYISTNRYYCDSNGNQITGWKEISGKKYYFAPTQVGRGGGICYADDKPYMFDSDGALQENAPGWLGQKYVNEDGSLAIGWKKIDGKWYYFDSWNFEMCCPNGGTRTVDGKRYLFGNDGALIYNQPGWHEVTLPRASWDNITQTFGFTVDSEGVVQVGWSLIRYTYDGGDSSDAWYYIESNGDNAFGWKKLDGKWYYFNPQQVCRDGGAYQIDDKTYLFDSEGALIQHQPGWYETTVSEGDNVTVPVAYYFVTTEVVARGWKKIDGKWYYFNPQQACHNGAGIVYIDNKYYFFGEDGTLVQNQAGWHECKTNQYDDGTEVIEGFTIDNEGALPGGWHMRKYVYPSGGTWEYWSYLNSEGDYEYGWKKIDGKWYYFNSNQVCRNGGTCSIDGKAYLFGLDGALIQRQPGWYEQTEIDDGYSYTIRCYFKTNEELATGWYKIDGKWYYFSWTGELYSTKAGIYQIEDKYYLFDTDGTLVYGKPGWQSVREYNEYHEYDEYSCNINSGGVIQEGWYIETHYWLGYGQTFDYKYYFDANGQKVYGWKKIDGEWYYFRDWDGRQVGVNGGTETIDGKLYYFSKEDGSLVQHGIGWYEVQQTNWDGSTYSNWYYFTTVEEVATGWTKIGGDWYYFDTNGKQLGREDNIVSIGAKHYAFDENGKLLQYHAGLYKAPKVKDPSGEEHESDWYYLATDGEVLSGWKKIDGKWYYFRGDGYYGYGKMVCMEGGLFRADDEKNYYFAKGGALLTDDAGWKKFSRKFIENYYNYSADYIWCYVDNNGVAATGLQTIGGKKYYFNSRGVMIENEDISLDEKWYVFGAGGAQVTKSGWCKILSNPNTQEYSWYYINEDGTAKEGWLKDGGKWYYLYPRMACNETVTVVEGNVGKQYLFDKSGALVQYNAGWNKKTYTVNGVTITDWYYLNSAGETQYGYRQIDGKWYYFRDYDGVMVSGQTYEVEGEDKLFTNDGSQAVAQGWYKCRNYSEWDNTWYTYWYYIDSDGELADSWKKIDGKWYYFDGGVLRCANGGVEYIYEDEKYYFFANGGALGTKGWNKLTKTVDGQTQTFWYYLNSAGEVQTGWQKIDGKWYYLSEDYYDERGHMYCDGLYWIDGTCEYFNQNGICETAMGIGSWRRVGDGLRYVQTDGTYATGWKTIEAKDYFFDENGEMMTGWVEYNGKTFFFNPNPYAGGVAMITDEEGRSFEYIFNSDGSLLRDGSIWLNNYGGYYSNEEDLCFYADSQGRMYSGWKKLNGKWYYFNPWMMANCDISDNGRSYRLDKDGAWTGESWKTTTNN